MKKFMAVLFAVVVLFTFATTALAYDSPVAEGIYKVTVVDGNNSKPSSEQVTSGGDISVEAKQDGTFDGWSIYKEDKTEAVLGVDYEFVEGDATSRKATIRPLRDGLIICANYNGQTTKPITADEYVSPQTGDSLALILFGAMALSLAGAVVLKKQLVK